MYRRIHFALAAPALVIPFQALQAGVLMRLGALSLHDWATLVVANVILLLGACALAADFPLMVRWSGYTMMTATMLAAAANASATRFSRR